MDNIKITQLQKISLPVKPVFSLCLTAFLLSACSFVTPNNQPLQNKEYFPSSAMKVAASPRVVKADEAVPRGGGRSLVGKPYKVKDTWYYPQANPKKVQTGLASWYGDAFHGRLTANGEVYDKNHLSAAHPTMPLPSYARVTNLENGKSIIVRVNDRGPFAKGRVIDLSKQAAVMLDYTQKGTTKVKIEYVGAAPLHGDDTSYLLASYKDSTTAPATGKATMLATNIPTPIARPSSIQINDDKQLASVSASKADILLNNNKLPAATIAANQLTASHKKETKANMLNGELVANYYIDVSKAVLIIPSLQKSSQKSIASSMNSKSSSITSVTSSNINAKLKGTTLVANYQPQDKQTTLIVPSLKKSIKVSQNVTALNDPKSLDL